MERLTFLLLTLVGIGTAFSAASASDTKEILASLTTKIWQMEHGEKATQVFNALKAHAHNSQASVLSMLHSTQLSAPKVKIHSFWISNQIFIGGADLSLIETLAAIGEVMKIDEEITITLDDPISGQSESTNEGEWGIQIIQAKEAWAIGGYGEGAIVGIIDTGARHTHEAISDSYRGGRYSWYDPYIQSKEPRDGHGHGTHVTGTIVGKFGIGVAPKAHWISCKGLDDFGFGSQAALISCGEFMACPHTYDGTEPTCSFAPHLVSNSWGSVSEIIPFDAVIDAWHAAGIIPVFSAGNRGPVCSSITFPSDSKSGVISVAATDYTNAIASFSSRGPSKWVGKQKPDVSAPGVNVRSSWIGSDNAYNTFSGTSMACPHVAGVVTLLKSKNPKASYGEIKAVLFSTAFRNLTFGNVKCNGNPEWIFPNHSFGHGVINAFEAMKEILKIK